MKLSLGRNQVIEMQYTFRKFPFSLEGIFLLGRLQSISFSPDTAKKEGCVSIKFNATAYGGKPYL